MGEGIRRLLRPSCPAGCSPFPVTCESGNSSACYSGYPYSFIFLVLFLFVCVCVCAPCHLGSWGHSLPHAFPGQMSCDLLSVACKTSFMSVRGWLRFAFPAKQAYRFIDTLFSYFSRSSSSNEASVSVRLSRFSLSEHYDCIRRESISH